MTESGHRRVHLSPSTFPEREEDTHSGLPLSSMPPLSDDVHEALGQIMGTCARHGRHLQAVKTQLGTMQTELVGMRKDIELDRGALVEGASHTAAKRSSNRMAALMGCFFTLYEIASPYLHEMAKWLHHG
jgi:hypothetical protein